MQVDMPLEGLQIKRRLMLDDENAVFKVTEQVTNTNPLGRLYNMVQHPTLATPFLTASTVVNCNAGTGFNYMHSTKPLQHTAQWPYGIMEDMGKMNLSVPDKAYSSVFCFTIKKEEDLGWITAYAPENNLLIGYMWKREDYAWINLWQHFDGDENRYHGLEFGTTGMHRSYQQIIAERNHRVFDEDTYKYIDAGETQSRGYMAFMCKTAPDFKGTGSVKLNNGEITITDAATTRSITIKTTLGNVF